VKDDDDDDNDDNDDDKNMQYNWNSFRQFKPGDNPVHFNNFINQKK
jgi:hypothetical protein